MVKGFNKVDYRHMMLQKALQVHPKGPFPGPDSRIVQNVIEAQKNIWHVDASRALPC
jgi:hypothetical protein